MDLKTKLFFACAHELNRLKGFTLQKLRCHDAGEMALTFYRPSERVKVVLSMQSPELLPCIQEQAAKRSLVVQEMMRRHLLSTTLQNIWTQWKTYSLIIWFESQKGILCQWGHETRFVLVQHAQLSLESPFKMISLVEWFPQLIKTKSRETFSIPFEPDETLPVLSEMVSQSGESLSSPPAELHKDKIEYPRLLKTREEFLKRRLKRQREDYASLEETAVLKKRLQGLQALLGIWPPHVYQISVPSDWQTLWDLPPVLEIKRSQKPSDLLKEWSKKLKKIDRSREVLSQRIQQSIDELAVLEQAKEKWKEGDPSAWESYRLTWAPVQTSVSKKLDEKKLIYRSFVLDSGDEIRVCKKAADVPEFLKMMPSHHLWFHTVTGTGAHVWLVPKRKQEPSPMAKRYAKICALLFSKQHHKQKGGDVHEARREHVKLFRKGSPGAVKILKSEVTFVSYTEQDLEQLTKKSNRIKISHLEEDTKF